MINYHYVFIIFSYKHINTFSDNFGTLWTNILQPEHSIPKIAIFLAIDSIFSQNRVPFVFMINIVSIHVLWYLNCLLIFYWPSKLTRKCNSCSPKRMSRKNRKIHGFQKNPYFVPHVCIKSSKIFWDNYWIHMYLAYQWFYHISFSFFCGPS